MIAKASVLKLKCAEKLRIIPEKFKNTKRLGEQVMNLKKDIEK